MIYIFLWFHLANKKQQWPTVCQIASLIPDFLFVVAPQITNITRWHGQIMAQDVFCKSETEVTGGKGISAFKVYHHIYFTISLGALSLLFKGH